MIGNLNSDLARELVDDRARVARERQGASLQSAENHRRQRELVPASLLLSRRRDRHRGSAADSELERLVRAAAGGEDAAWSSLMARFSRRLTSLARGYRLNADDVDDVIQTTFVRLLEHIGNVREPKALPGWLETTARRESLRLVRARGRERPMDEETVCTLLSRESVDTEIVAAETRDEIERALAALPERPGTLLRLLHADSAPSYQEISRATGMAVGSIGPARARALERLRRDETLMGALRFETG